MYDYCQRLVLMSDLTNYQYYADGQAGQKDKSLASCVREAIVYYT